VPAVEGLRAGLSERVGWLRDPFSPNAGSKRHWAGIKFFAGVWARFSFKKEPPILSPTLARRSCAKQTIRLQKDRSAPRPLTPFSFLTAPDLPGTGREGRNTYHFFNQWRIGALRGRRCECLIRIREKESTIGVPARSSPGGRDRGEAGLYGLPNKMTGMSGPVPGLKEEKSVCPPLCRGGWGICPGMSGAGSHRTE